MKELYIEQMNNNPHGFQPPVEEPLPKEVMGKHIAIGDTVRTIKTVSIEHPKDGYSYSKAGLVFKVESKPPKVRQLGDNYDYFLKGTTEDNIIVRCDVSDVEKIEKNGIL